MPAQPNLSGGTRVVYVLLGIVLSAWGILGEGSDWLRITALMVGGALIVEGSIGF